MAEEKAGTHAWDDASIEPDDRIQLWCEHISKNGIEQHSREWLLTKRYTVGGSSIAIIAGLNSFQSLREYISMKLEITHFKPDIKPQWGNLFEDVIKREVEYMYKRTVHGEDLYVPGTTPETSYSPDGLGIIGNKIVLFEFKCPYSRIPGREPPKYYTPQVKMGLELIPIADYGLYAEAVYRRCTWDDLGPSGIFDNILVDKPSKPVTPISYGFVGVYIDTEGVAAALAAMRERGFQWPRMMAAADGDDLYDDREPVAMNDPLQIPMFCEEFGEFISLNNDLSQASPNLFRNIMAAIDGKYLRVWHSAIIRERDQRAANAAINAELAKYRAVIGGCHNYGVISWKLLRIETHRIDREPGYLEPYLPKIKKIVDFVKSQWETGATIPQKIAALDMFMEEYNGGTLYEGD